MATAVMTRERQQGAGERCHARRDPARAAYIRSARLTIRDMAAHAAAMVATHTAISR